MRYLVTILFFALCGVSYGQTITGTKTRTPGVWLSSKDTATNRTSADSIQIIANRADSSLRFYWSVGAPSRKFAFGNDLALKLNISDTAAMLTNYVQKFGSLTNRRVPFVNNLGQLKDTAGLTFEGGALNVTGGVINTGALNSGNINASGDVAFQNALFVKYYNNIGGQYFHKFGGTDASSDYRWRFDTYGTESGSNSGSDLIMYKYTDGGAYNGYNITMERATGNTRFYNALQVDGGITGTLSTAAQPNITSLGTLSSLTVSGNITTATISTTGNINTSQSFNSSIGSSSGGNNVVIAKQGNDPRWSIGLIGTDGTNTGSDFYLYGYLDNGTAVPVFRTTRASGAVSFGNTITATGATFRGNISLGNTSSSSPALATFQNSANGFQFGFSSTGTQHFTFVNGGGSEVASIDGTTGAYTALSDSSIKKNIFYSGNALSTINQIKVRQYDWKVSDAHEPFGVVAQELYLIAPTYVSRPIDNSGRWGVQKAEMVPMLIKGIQELKAENDLIKKELADLEALLKSKGIL